ncbi:hypothetical protein GUJ93_ZPchr0006g42724 [Zizania palustris]|uniref:Uncharacterized protein n=1 Tax=Zizania palustris TaxID=103762 RepID=A0A8J5SIC5_ZIZPA|nr:hypothetical protein GUJ93_ZPchr0006g42724 [Zizania palustris]
MEFLVCNQFFPHFQAKSKLLQRQLADPVKVARDEWRERETGLVSQLKLLSSGKRRAEEKLLQFGSSLEVIKGKLAYAERMVASHEVEKKQLLLRLEMEMGKDELICRLEKEIAEKAADASREKDAHQRLLQQVELKDKDLLLEQNKKINQNEGSKSPVDNLVSQKTSESPPSKRKLKDLVDTKKESIQVDSMTREQKNGPASCANVQGSEKHASSHAANARDSMMPFFQMAAQMVISMEV